ncbi:hypothetical protein RHSIM_Rhsim08G0115100 [Rhododendron simsii]|uniref:Ternary complex factor MIP1 leucine-zipper domain-containing protein n=1 Tax=Rhododendron simsii TaxID=118357 RepID=A0A834LH25_RHOSS|nr:hypothetical protein RHSIM_Rhsim08G0115100 [Rhododendron simsii]
MGKDDDGQVSDSRDMLSCKREYFDEASDLNYQVLPGDTGKSSCSGSESDKDEAIKPLRGRCFLDKRGLEEDGLNHFQEASHRLKLPATELIKEIAILELEVGHLEQYLFSLHW